MSVKYTKKGWSALCNEVDPTMTEREETYKFSSGRSFSKRTIDTYASLIPTTEPEPDYYRILDGSPYYLSDGEGYEVA